MPQIFIHVDEGTLKAVVRMIKDEIHRQETDRMREAYLLQPDSSDDSERWDMPEEWAEE